MNTFYHGDCLFVMNHDIEPESVDLIYLDPPFFTGKKQTGIAKWKPGEMPITYEDGKQFWKEKGLASYAPEWQKHLASDLNRPDFAAYLFYMMQRLEACYRVLKNTGSIYLHCDWRASHYLKMIMDEIFGYNHFKDEIIWHYRGRGMQKQCYQRKHDIILYYTKGNTFTFNTKPILIPLDPHHTSRYNKVDEQGKPFALIKGHGGNYSKVYRKDGIIPDDVWDMPFIHGKEAMGYPTQKPLALLRRIIEASSNEGDTVLDPFCGCGTAIVAASNLGRQWIGIDISKFAYEVTITRKDNTRPMLIDALANSGYISRDLDEVLAIQKPQGKDSFEEWVNEYFKATKPSPDGGVDGITKDGIPIQTKTNIIKEPVLHQFIHQATSHSKVPKPVNHIIAVSQIGFDDNAQRLKFNAKTNEHIRIDLFTPQQLLDIEALK